MVHRFGSGARATLAGCASLLALTAWSPEVEACSPPPVGWYAGLHNVEIPTDGYLIVSMYCSAACGSGPVEPTITVRDMSTGTEVPGAVAPLLEVADSEHVYGWRATSALVAGGSYEVEIVPSSPGSIPYPLQVVAPENPSLDTLDLTVDVLPVENTVGERVCCPSGPLDSCGGHYCYDEKIQRSVRIWLDWSLTTKAALFTQYLNRVIWEGVDEPGPWNIRLAAPGDFDTAQAEYCYTLELKSLIDDSIQRLDGCVAHPAGIELGVFDVDPVEIQRSLGTCEEPPAGTETDWCKARIARCAELSLQLCENLNPYCATEPPGTGGTSGTGGTDGTGGDAGGPDGDSPDGQSRKRIYTGDGCAVAAVGAEQRGRFAWMLLAVAFAFARARRTRRVERSAAA